MQRTWGATQFLSDPQMSVAALLPAIAPQGRAGRSRSMSPTRRPPPERVQRELTRRRGLDHSKPLSAGEWQRHMGIRRDKDAPELAPLPAAARPRQSPMELAMQVAPRRRPRHSFAQAAARRTAPRALQRAGARLQLCIESDSAGLRGSGIG